MSHSPYVDLDRGAWAKLGESAPLPLSAIELDALRSLGDPVDLDEVREVYLPLTRLLALHVEESGRLYEAYRTFLEPGEEPPLRTPFVIGIAGSVSVGKSTIARLLLRFFDATGGWTVPQILIDGNPIGGYVELWQLDRSGRLDALLAA